jgi:hypothetical protein
MESRTNSTTVSALLLAGILTLPAPLVAQSPQSETSGAIANVTLKQDVLANGERLTAGVYALRAADDEVKPVRGQTPSESRWVEFVQNGEVRGREMAVVLSTPQALRVLKGRRPSVGRPRVDRLRGGDYVRVWVNRGSQHYLLHLATATQ